MRRMTLAILLTGASLLVAASGAQAVVVNDRGNTAGVALVPSTRGNLAKAGITAVTASVSTAIPGCRPTCRCCRRSACVLAAAR